MTFDRRTLHPALAPLGAAALTLAVVACTGGGTSAGPADMAALPPDLLGADLKDSTYPPGPYAQAGNVNVGDVLPDFSFQGYWSPNALMGLANSKPYGEVTFGMMHDSGARYAIVALSAFW